MSDEIEIYVRQSGDRTLLNFYISRKIRDAFLSALQNGSFEDRSTNINLELSALDKWRTDRTDTNISEPHIRVPITAINIQFVD